MGMDHPPLPTLLTPDEVCAWLQVEKKLLYRLVQRRSIPCIRVSRLLRFDRADLLRWLRQMRTAASGEVSHGGQAMERPVDRRLHHPGRAADPKDVARPDAPRRRAVRGGAQEPPHKIGRDGLMGTST